MNIIDWLRESAVFLAADRPDLYDQETAVAELSVAMDHLREAGDQEFVSLIFSSYVLMRIYMEGVEEFLLTRKLSSAIIFEAEEETGAYSHTHHINLPSPLDEPDET